MDVKRLSAFLSLKEQDIEARWEMVYTGSSIWLVCLVCYRVFKQLFLGITFNGWLTTFKVLNVFPLHSFLSLSMHMVFGRHWYFIRLS